MQCILLLFAGVFFTCYDIYEMNISVVGAEICEYWEIREEQDRKSKHTCLEVNFPLTVNLIEKVTKINWHREKYKTKNIL